MVISLASINGLTVNHEEDTLELEWRDLKVWVSGEVIEKDDY